MEPWQEALSKMPLSLTSPQLSKTNAIPLMLAAFQKNDAAKALIFLPGATDEFYFFNRGHARLTNDSPTLLDAIAALTNQTLIHVTYRAPFILLHSAEDSLEPVAKIMDQRTAGHLREKHFVKHFIYEDRNWRSLLRTLTFQLDTKILPLAGTHESHHFYRHNLAGFDLNGWEILEALAYAGKTQFTVERKKIIFEGDPRFRERPTVPENFEALKELNR
ncbi:MAG: hypothetical protein ABJC04_07975 [Verrucomicrobiota bacterium]